MSFSILRKLRPVDQFGLTALVMLSALVFAFLQGAASDVAAAQDKDSKSGGKAADKPGLQINTDKAFKGYTLFSPIYHTSFYLIDMDGKVVKSWEGGITPSAYAYLLPNGNLLRPCVQEDKANKMANGGGAGGRIQEFNWDGTLVWDYLTPPEKRQHHDTIKLPNGNYLMQVWDVRSAKDCADAGRRDGAAIQFDSLIEVRPTGKNSGEIVWEWNLFDHLIQDADKTKANFGDVAAHPELVDFNYNGPNLFKDLFKGKDGAKKEGEGKGDKDKGPPPAPKGGGLEWTHVNGIAYNPELDQIMMSVHKFSEVWIIDHSTTKAEAKGHTGGKSGKGGDLLYRWGNPQVYRAGDASKQELYSQHNAHWIPKGLPGAGHILVFSNGNDRPGEKYSSVEEIIPPVDGKGAYAYKPGTASGPEKAVWSYSSPGKNDFYSTYISGSQRLPNGNTLICNGMHGILFEVTPQKEIAWKYINPLGGKSGGPGAKSGNDVFRAYRYGADYPGLAGKELTPGKTLEEMMKKGGK